MKNRKEEMQLHLSAWRASGMSKSAYCKAHGLAYHNFLYHYKRNESASSEVGFTLLSSKGCGVGKVEFHLPNGSYFLLPADCQVELLQKLVSLC